MDEKYRVGSLDESPFQTDSLVGSYLHAPKKQGCVVAEPAPGLFLVQWFGWGYGTPTHQTLHRIEDMMEWHFYDEAEGMKAAVASNRVRENFDIDYPHV